ncbi:MULTISPECIES: hypothetical protein [unclassified Streptomyces]|uniref:hypothetical protein n=1 Tax=unclassified Streptomyces TaxID=2593676 RepID=UPI000A730B22|nr:hypothetical protein [Streptomyces sp. TSRI0281]
MTTRSARTGTVPSRRNREGTGRSHPPIRDNQAAARLRALLDYIDRGLPLAELEITP